MITIDGSLGEGGGQVLRTALGLSLITGQSFRIYNIRARRKKPGLKRQHLCAVQAAQQIASADVSGLKLGSLELSFHPRKTQPGEYHFSIGTAGSTSLVLQTILPALLLAEGPSHFILEGGTHNPLAPPFEFIEKVFLPIIHRMGPKVEICLDRYGFYPAGGGKVRVEIQPADALLPLEIMERGFIKDFGAQAKVAHLPIKIAERELKVIKHQLPLVAKKLEIQEILNSPGPGNVVMVEVVAEQITEVFTAFGALGKPAEKVAQEVVEETQEYLDSGVPVGKYLADQLLIPLALAGRGGFKTLPLTQHTQTNILVLNRFLDKDFVIKELDKNQTLVEVCSPKA